MTKGGVETQVFLQNAVAVYVPYDGRPHMGYVLCKRCAKLTTGTLEQQASLTKRVELYLDGGAE